MCLSQSCTVVLLRVVCTNVICVAIIFKAPVDVVQGAYMPICTKDDRVEFHMKWEHILKYIQLGPYQVENGQTVAEFLKSLN